MDVVEATRADIDDLVAVHAAVDAESEPDVPPVGAAELALELFRFPASRHQRVWLARRDGVPLGTVQVGLPQEANRNHADAFVMVAPEQRGHGCSDALLATALRSVEAERDVLRSWVEAGVASTLCERLGLTQRQVVRYDRLRISTVDDDQQRAWIDEGPAAALGYRIVTWRGPAPDEHLTEVGAARDAMADAPIGDIEYEITKTTPEQLRDEESAVEGRLDTFGALALAADGAAAGFTEIFVRVHRPSVGYQGDTAVAAAHRGHGIGRWLKAVNLAQARAAHGELELLTTFNAETNPWMIAINQAMGYVPHKTYLAYQGSLAGALEVLEVRDR